MTRHVIVKVASTHHGAVPPGLMIVLKDEHVQPLYETPPPGCECTFENPVSGGYSFGTVIAFVDLPDEV